MRIARITPSSSSSPWSRVSSARAPCPTTTPSVPPTSHLASIFKFQPELRTHSRNPRVLDFAWKLDEHDAHWTNHVCFSRFSFPRFYAFTVDKGDIIIRCVFVCLRTRSRKIHASVWLCTDWCCSHMYADGRPEDVFGVRCFTCGPLSFGTHFCVFLLYTYGWYDGWLVRVVVTMRAQRNGCFGRPLWWYFVRKTTTQTCAHRKQHCIHCSIYDITRTVTNKILGTR